ncbi:hypothetical protein L3X38_025198 [Prunus dulcis]|uniref:Uncharacterized protein n=1 Tax=Prunus dulcis TaxID=3755 RepID=A0AAD4Z6U6_PRUDU|nr:hypothetical protein L3X38_025198 [Prunus dulcis]
MLGEVANEGMVVFSPQPSHKWRRRHQDWLNGGLVSAVDREVDFKLQLRALRETIYPSVRLGGGYSTKDVYPSDDQDCNKRICLEREEEHEKLKEEVKDLKSVLYELKDVVQSMRENNSNTYARSRQSAPMDNVESCSDAHLEDE